MPSTTFQIFAKFLSFGILAIFLTACNVQNTPKKPTLYPIYTHDTNCQAISSAKQPLFLEKLQQLKKGMKSNEVVNLLGIEPNYYRQNDDKRLNAPIQYYQMGYTFNCADVVGNASIWLKFSTDEKLIEVQVGKDVNIDKLDSSLILQVLKKVRITHLPKNFQFT